MPLNNDQAEVTFVTADQGEVQSGQKTADTMNKLSAAEMQAVLGAEVGVLHARKKIIITSKCV